MKLTTQIKKQESQTMNIIKITNRTAYIIAVAALVATTSCTLFGSKTSTKRRADEKMAVKMLNDARRQLAEGNYDNARKTIRDMRNDCRYALEGREAGILLLDSIDLLQAQNDTTLDDKEMRIHFYKKKLEHDRKARQTH